jgi:hypothetical protein
MEGVRNAYKVFIRKPERKRLLQRHRHKWEDIRMYLREIGWKGVDWMNLAQARDQWWAVTSMVINFWVP